MYVCYTNIQCIHIYTPLMIYYTQEVCNQLSLKLNLYMKIILEELRNIKNEIFDTPKVFISSYP